MTLTRRKEGDGLTVGSMLLGSLVVLFHLCDVYEFLVRFELLDDGYASGVVLLNSLFFSRLRPPNTDFYPNDTRYFTPFQEPHQSTKLRSK